MKRVNLYVDEQLWEDFRIACIKRHISASQQASLLLVQWLHEQEGPEKPRAQAQESA
jgi:hypothetical protein